MLLEGQMYDIHRFSTKQQSYGLRVVENPVIIQFNGHTVFCRVPETLPPILAHSFRLIRFSQLKKERKAQAVPSSEAPLTDIYGCVKSIRPPHPQFVKSQNKISVKCEIILENLGRETLTVVFWGKLAKDFDVDAIASLPPPVLAVFTGLKVGEYKGELIANNYDHTCVLINPTTPWTEAYEIEFSKPGDKTAIKGDFHVFETDEPKHILTVLRLTGLNPAEYRAISILCKGQIIKIGSEGWWYRCCPEPACHKQCFKIEEVDNKYKCKVHGLQTPVPCFRVNALIGDEVSDLTVTVMGNQAEKLFGCKLAVLRSKRFYVTEQIIPPELTATIGEVHIFELKGNTYGEWIVISIEPSTDSMAITQPLSNATTSSTTEIPELSLQTLEKPSTEPKRAAEGIQKELFPEGKKTRREGKEISMSSSTDEDKQKLD